MKFDKKVCSEVIRLGIIMIVYSFVNNTKVSDYLIMLIGVIATAIISNFSYIFYRPVKIEIIMKNAITGKNQVDLIDTDRKINERSSTVVLNVKILKSNGLWNSIAYKIIKNKELYLILNSELLGGNKYFIYQPAVLMDGEKIKFDYMNMKIDIKDIVLNNLQSSASQSFTFEFYIKVNRDNYPPISQEFEINSSIEYSNFLSKLIIDLKQQDDESCYKINYCKEGI